MRKLWWFGLIGAMSALPWMFACEPAHDRCVVAKQGDPVGFDEVGPPGFAASDVLLPAGTYEVQDGRYDLLVTLSWSDTATPRTYRWVDGDGDGQVPQTACPMDYSLRGTIAVDSGDGKYDEKGSAGAVASEGGSTALWVTIDADDVKGTAGHGRDLWLEIYESQGVTWFGLTAVSGSDADYLVDAPMVSVDP